MQKQDSMDTILSNECPQNEREYKRRMTKKKTRPILEIKTDIVKEASINSDDDIIDDNEWEITP